VGSEMCIRDSLEEVLPRYALLDAHNQPLPTADRELAMHAWLTVTQELWDKSQEGDRCSCPHCELMNG